MTINQLTYLVAVIEARINLSRASRHLGISQPNISKQIALLEEEIGAPLFERAGRRLRALTPVGRQLYRHAINVTEELVRLRENVSPHAVERNVVIGATAATTRYVVPGMLAAAAPETRDLEIEVENLGGNEIAQAVLDGRCDIGLISGPVRPDKNLLFLPWYRWRYRLIFARGSEVGEELRNDHRAIKEHLVAACASIAAPRPAIMRAMEALNIIPQIALMSPDPEEVKNRVRTNGHIGLIAEMVYSEELDDDLDSCESPPPFPTLVSWIAIRRASPVRSGVAALLGEVASHLEPALIERLRTNGPIEDPSLATRNVRLPRYG